MNKKFIINPDGLTGKTTKQLKAAVEFLCRSKDKIADNFILVSIASFLWFLFRSGRKPSRMVYPCQRAAMANLGIALTALPLLKFHKLKHFFKRHSAKISKVIKSLLIVLVVFSLLASSDYLIEKYQIKKAWQVYEQKLLQDKTIIAYAQEAGPRVVSVHNSNATTWTGSGNSHDYLVQSEIDEMVERGVKSLTGKGTLAEAWSDIIPYQAGESVAIKLNFNNMWLDWNENPSSINPYAELIISIIKGLTLIGVPQDKIWLTDPSRAISDQFREKISLAGYSGVQYYTKLSPGGRPNVFQTGYVTDGSPYSTQVNPGYGLNEWINPAQVFVDADHIINIPQLKGHGITSITLGLKNHFGSVDFTQYASGSSPLHNNAYFNNILADISDNPVFKNKTRLIIGDGLYGHPTINYMGVSNFVSFGGTNPEILFFGADPVAVDSVMFDYLQRECQARGASPRQDNILAYAESIGLGVFEHWNNNTDRQYSAIDYTELDMDLEPDDVPPATITDLAASTGANVGEINITWTAPGDDGDTGRASSYIIKYSQTQIIDSNWDSAAVVSNPPSPKTAGSSESFTVTGLTQGQTYYFAIKARDEVSNTSGISNSPSAMAKEQDQTPPNIPQNLSATVNGEKIDLTWTASTDPESGIASYKLYRGTSSEGETFYQNVGNILSYQDTGTQPNATYYYKVSAVNGAGLEGGLSNEASATTEDNPPLQPQNLQATPGDTQATLTWNQNPEPDLDHYNIYRGTSPNFTPQTPISAPTNTYTDTNLINDTTYYYKISAVDQGSNESAYSQEVSATPQEQSNLVAYWKFDEGSGAIITDSSGYDNNGAINGSTWQTGAECISGSCLSFDGLDDYVTMGTDSTLADSPLNVTGALTLAAWIKIDTTPSYAGIIAKADNNSWAHNQYFLGLDSANHLRFAVQKGNGSAEAQIIGTTNLDTLLGTWLFVTGVFDATNQRLILYLNALENATQVSTGISTIRTTDAPVWIGQEFGGPFRFDGLIDEVRIYNRALTAQEIQEHYQPTLKPNITLTKSAIVNGQPASEAAPGDIITYTIAYKNIGTGEATKVVITDPIPAGTIYETDSARFASGSGIINDKGPIISWTIAALPAGQTGEAEFRVIVAE